MVRLENVTFSYEDQHPVLKDFNLTINKGELVAILGQNGSGKSTLSKLLVGLERPLSGEIIIDGQVLNEQSLYDLRAQIGIVFQNPDNQFVGSTVRDDIAFGLENKCVPYEEMKRLVEEFSAKVGMAHFLDREPQTLSGGEKQRVAIAGCLARESKLLILDEATAMLDPRGRQEMIALIKELAQDEEKTIMMITHHLDEAIFSDRIIIMNQGEIILDGTPQAVFTEKELLERVKLDVPFAVKVTHALKEKGIINEIYTHDEELIKQLWSLNLNQ